MIAFLCKNWDAKHRKPTNDLVLDGPFAKAAKQGTHEDAKVTCPACRKIMFARK